MSAALDAVESKLRDDALAECKRICSEDMEAAVDGPGWMVITELPTDLWARLRGIVKQAVKQALALTSQRLQGFGCACCTSQCVTGYTPCSAPARCILLVVCMHRAH